MLLLPHQLIEVILDLRNIEIDEEKAKKWSLFCQWRDKQNAAFSQQQQRQQHATRGSTQVFGAKVQIHREVVNFVFESVKNFHLFQHIESLLVLYETGTCK